MSCRSSLNLFTYSWLLHPWPLTSFTFSFLLSCTHLGYFWMEICGIDPARPSHFSSLLFRINSSPPSCAAGFKCLKINCPQVAQLVSSIPYYYSFTSSRTISFLVRPTLQERSDKFKFLGKINAEDWYCHCPVYISTHTHTESLCIDWLLVPLESLFKRNATYSKQNVILKYIRSLKVTQNANGSEDQQPWWCTCSCKGRHQWRSKSCNCSRTSCTEVAHNKTLQQPNRCIYSTFPVTFSHFLFVSHYRTTTTTVTLP